MYFSWWIASLVFKDVNMEIVLGQCQLRPPGERWQPRLHFEVRCLITQAALGKEVVQNHPHDPFLATQVLRVVDLMEGFFGGIVHVLWEACSFCHSQTCQRDVRCFPPPQINWEGCQGNCSERLTSVLCSVRDTVEWSQSDCLLRALEVISFGWTSKWGGLAGSGLHGLSCWHKNACFLWTRGGICPRQSWCGVIVTPAQGTTWRGCCLPGATQRGGTEDLGRKSPSALPDSQHLWWAEGCKWPRQGNCRWESPEWGMSPEPRKVPWGERDTPSLQSTGTRLWPCQLSQTFSPSWSLLLPPHCDPERVRNWWEIIHVVESGHVSFSLGRLSADLREDRKEDVIVTEAWSFVSDTGPHILFAEVNFFVTWCDQRTFHYLRVTRKVKGPALIPSNGGQSSSPPEQIRTNSRVVE